MNNKDLYKPIILDELNPFLLLPEDGKYRDLEFSEPIFQAQFVEEINGCRLTKVRISGELKKVKFIDCLFIACDLSNLELNHSLFYRCRFENCKGTGSIFRKSSFKKTEFYRCIFPLTDFSECQFEAFKITESNFSESAFQSCKQTQFISTLVDFSEADFTETSLNKMDLSGCNLEGVRLSPQYLKGLTVDVHQALGLVTLLGVKVKE